MNQLYYCDFPDLINHVLSEAESRTSRMVLSLSNNKRFHIVRKRQ